MGHSSALCLYLGNTIVLQQHLRWAQRKFVMYLVQLFKPVLAFKKAEAEPKEFTAALLKIQFFYSIKLKVA